MYKQKAKEQSEWLNRNHPDIMNVDAVEVNAALTTEEAEKRKKEGQCFYCNKQGHMKQDCPKIKYEGKGKEGPSFKAKV